MRIVWFRDDLRVRDNPALFHALSSGEEVMPLYIYDTGSERPLGAASKWWLHHALTSLHRILTAAQGELVVKRGTPLAIFEELARTYTISAIHTNIRYDGYGRACDNDLVRWCREHGILWEEYTGSLLHKPEDIQNGSGGEYKVFTPFRNALFKLEKRETVPFPHGQFIAESKSLDIASLGLLPVVPWAEGLVRAWPEPTEEGAHLQLARFFENAIESYKTDRDIPSRSGTSRLSPYLRFGQISPIHVWHQVHAHMRGHGHKWADAEHFLSELSWREFSYHLLASHPQLHREPLRPEFARFPWKFDPVRFEAWTKGQTGVPIVDAGMRELWSTGYMHNRVRMTVASYLIKNLNIPWQYGEAWFWDTLVDADPANNPASWQWVAGCGRDAAPFFRIFNPVLQSEKFDPSGTYIKAWVPELAPLAPPDLFSPWEMNVEESKRCGVMLGETYPLPLVDLRDSRNEALLNYKKVSS